MTTRWTLKRASWRRRVTLVGSALLLLLAVPDVMAHGVEYQVEYGSAVQVRFSGHGGSALADASYRVFAPDGMQVFVRGRTDPEGRAVFVPDAPGSWRLMLATEDGHGADVDIPVTADDLAGRVEPVSIQMGDSSNRRLSATLSGLGYLLGIAGMWMLWRSRTMERVRRNSPSAHS